MTTTPPTERRNTITGAVLGIIVFACLIFGPCAVEHDGPVKLDPPPIVNIVTATTAPCTMLAPSVDDDATGDALMSLLRTFPQFDEATDGADYGAQRWTFTDALGAVHVVGYSLAEDAPIWNRADCLPR